MMNVGMSISDKASTFSNSLSTDDAGLSPFLRGFLLSASSSALHLRHRLLCLDFRAELLKLQWSVKSEYLSGVLSPILVRIQASKELLDPVILVCGAFRISLHVKLCWIESNLTATDHQQTDV